MRQGSALSLLTLVSRVLGLLREMTKASLLGTSVYSDAFSVAFLLPNLFRRLFAEGSIAVAFIPTFKEFLLADDKKETREFLCAFWTFLSFIVSIAVALGILFAPIIVPFFNIPAIDETSLLTRIMFPYLLFISIAAFFQGILNSVHSFIPSALGPILLNITTIGASWLLSPYTANPARAMAIGIFAGGFLEAAVQLPFVIKKKFYFNFVSFSRSLKNPGTRKVLRLIVPTIAGMAAYQLNDVVSTALAGGEGEGIVSSLQYSLRLQELVLGVFAVTIGTIILPLLAEEAKTKNWILYNKRLKDSINTIALITVPVTFFSLLYGEDIIRLLYQTRKFDERSVGLTAAAFKFHIAGVFFIALNRVLAPAFYAQSDSASPALAGIISFAVNMLLAFTLVRFMSGGGIALALSIAGAVNSAFLFVFLKKNNDIKVRSIIMSSLLYLLKILIISILAILPLYFIKPPLFLGALFYAALGIIILFFIRDRYLAAFAAGFGSIRRRVLKRPN